MIIISGWISETELSSRLGYKILIAGLSEAGKTAVKRIFFLRKRTEDVDSLSATINYERMAVSISDVPITIVDLGGQRVFIKRFLSNFSPFIFSSVHAFLFLIDVSEKSTKNNSVQYFASCVEKLERYSKDTEFFVFLHKNDLVINSPNYESIHAQLKEEFQLACTKKVHFLRTTIYRPETVIDGFGRIFEITIPKIAQSDYVGGREIGNIEEHAEKFVIQSSVEVKECPECGTELTDTGVELICGFCGYYKSKEETTIVEAKKPASEPSFEEIMASDGSGDDVLETLHSLMADAIIDDKSKKQVVKPSLQKTENSKAVSEEIVKTEIPSVSKVLISKEHLMEFYGLTDDNAQKLLNSDYVETFETAAKAGMPVKLLLSIFFKYIPFIATKNVDIKTLNNKKLLEVFFAYLGGFIKQDQIFEILIFASKRPSMSVEEIAKKFLRKTKKEEIERKIPTSDERVQPIVTEIPVDKSKGTARAIEKIVHDVATKEEISSMAQITKNEAEAALETVEIPEISPKSESEEVLVDEESLIVLSEEENLSFTLDMINSNCKINFYSKKKLVSSTTVPMKLSIGELKYMISYESDLPVSDPKKFGDYAAPVVHRTIKDMYKYFEKKEKPIERLTLVPLVDQKTVEKIQKEIESEEKVIRKRTEKQIKKYSKPAQEIIEKEKEKEEKEEEKEEEKDDKTSDILQEYLELLTDD